MIKVIASDMDGTLLGDDHRIAPETLAAVKRGLGCGNPFYGRYRPEFSRCHGGTEGNRSDLRLCGEQWGGGTESPAGGCKEYAHFY